ncbi:MAG: carboxypeptidase-like regulatory domain-containing protein [Pyrinomonadaceae bacterium]
MKIQVLNSNKFYAAASCFNRWKQMLMIVSVMILSSFTASFGQTQTSRLAGSPKNIKSANQINALSGMISDNFGAAVSGVELILYKGSRKQSFNAVSNAEGNYRFKNLSAGIYTLEVKTKPGFRAYKSVNIKIKGGGESEFDITLKSTVKRPSSNILPVVSPTKN